MDEMSYRPKNYDRLEEMVAALVERRKGKIEKKLLSFKNGR